MTIFEESCIECGREVSNNFVKVFNSINEYEIYHRECIDAFNISPMDIMEKGLTKCIIYNNNEIVTTVKLNRNLVAENSLQEYLDSTYEYHNHDDDNKCDKYAIFRIIFWTTMLILLILIILYSLYNYS